MTAPTSAPSPGRWRVALVVAWVVAALVELVFASHAAVGPTLGVAAGHVLLMGVLGALQGRMLPPGDWRSGLASPAVLLAGSGALRSELIADWAWWPAVFIVPVIGIIAVRVLHDLSRRAPPLAAALVFAVLGGVADRAFVVFGSRVATPGTQLQTDLLQPLRSLLPKGTPVNGAPIVILTIDTLRADHAVETDSWAFLAERGATWDRAMTTASWTVPSVGSIVSGLLPADHGAGKIPKGGFSPLHEHVPTVALQLQQTGYHTQAFTVNPFVSTSLGFASGFDHFLNPDEDVAQPLALFGEAWELPGRDGKVVVDHALDWLDDAPETGWLLWVHLFDPHLPYTHLPDGHLAYKVKHPKQLRSGRIKATKKLKAAVKEAYAMEVAYSDAQALRLLEALDERGFFETGTLLFTSDHGEELWEHRDFEHGHSHHQEVTDVALALVSPGVAPGPRDTEASLLDLTPTLRAIAGLPDPGLGRTGVDLRGDIDAERIVEAAGNLYGSPQTSARNRSEKVIETRRKRRTKRCSYDRETDPGEQRCRPVEPELGVAAVAAALQTAAEGAKETDVPVEKLCELGYMSGPECEGHQD